MRPDALAALLAEDRAAGRVPFFTCATVGTTSSLAVDPVAQLVHEGVWLHVDGAMAGSAAVCPELRWVNDGLDRADSYAFNPHKWLFTNFDCTCFWVADRAALLTKPAGASGTGGSTVGQSGVSKRIDQAAGNDLLSKIAAVLGQAEKQLVDLALTVMGDGTVSSEDREAVRVLCSAVQGREVVGEREHGGLRLLGRDPIPRRGDRAPGHDHGHAEEDHQKASAHPGRLTRRAAIG